VTGKVLLVEDEAKLSRTVSLYLEQAGYTVLPVFDGALALPTFVREQPDLVVLDLMLPHVDGWSICTQIRRTSGVPILILTARSDETDRVIGLELGADDYVTKPFSPRELVARVRALLRRAQGHLRADASLRAAGIEINLERHTATVDGQPLDLTRYELLILAALVRDAGRVLTRGQLMDQLGDVSTEGFERVVDQHIKNLRTKLGDDARNPRYIATVYGVGYRFLAGGPDHA
jgi:two-component system alkaline phosphatase synthesis response regulator PhoP